MAPARELAKDAGRLGAIGTRARATKARAHGSSVGIGRRVVARQRRGLPHTDSGADLCATSLALVEERLCGRASPLRASSTPAKAIDKHRGSSRRTRLGRRVATSAKLDSESRNVGGAVGAACRRARGLQLSEDVLERLGPVARGGRWRGRGRRRRRRRRRRRGRSLSNA